MRVLDLATRKERWVFKAQGNVKTVLVRDAAVYFGGEDGGVYALSA